MINKKLKKILVGKRIDLELTQKQMAQELGISLSAYTRIESGESKFTYKIYEILAKTSIFTPQEIDRLREQIPANFTKRQYEEMWNTLKIWAIQENNRKLLTKIETLELYH